MPDTTLPVAKLLQPLRKAEKTYIDTQSSKQLQHLRVHQKRKSESSSIL